MIYTIVNGKYIIYDDFVIICEVWVEEKEWQDKVKGILKAELKRRNLSYKELADKLEMLGIKDSERNIANKLARGTFTAVFFVQCLVAIGCTSIKIEDN